MEKYGLPKTVHLVERVEGLRRVCTGGETGPDPEGVEIKSLGTSS